MAYNTPDRKRFHKKLSIQVLVIIIGFLKWSGGIAAKTSRFAGHSSDKDPGSAAAPFIHLVDNPSLPIAFLFPEPFAENVVFDEGFAEISTGRHPGSAEITSFRENGKRHPQAIGLAPKIHERSIPQYSANQTEWAGCSLAVAPELEGRFLGSLA